MSHLTKTETPLVIWLNIVTMVARSVRLLLAHIRKDIHATRQFHCQWWSGQCHAKHAENDASVHNTCWDKIAGYLQRIFNRNRKLKQQVSKLNALKSGVCSKIIARFIFVCIFSRYAKPPTFNFWKGMWQHTEGMVGSIIWIVLEIYFSFQQRKNFENPITIDNVIAMSLVYYFFGIQCIQITLTRSVNL